MSAVFLSAENTKAESSPTLKTTRLKTQKMAVEFEEKLAEAVRKYTCLYNKQSSDFKYKSKRKQVILLFPILKNFANPYISLSWC